MIRHGTCFCIAESGRTNEDGRRTGRGAEVVVQSCTAACELVAAPTASSTVTKSDVVSGREALSVWSSETGSTAVVYGAGPTADVVDAGAAVGDHSVQGRSWNDCVSDRFSDEREVSVGGREPVLHLRLGDDEGGDLTSIHNDEDSKVD